MQSSALLPGRVLQIRALEESMERQQNLEKTGGQECGGESSNGSNLDIASAGAGKVWSESSLDSGDGSSLSGLSCTPQSSTESPQVAKDACATDFVDTRAVDLLVSFSVSCPSPSNWLSCSSASELPCVSFAHSLANDSIIWVSSFSFSH